MMPNADTKSKIYVVIQFALFLLYFVLPDVVQFSFSKGITTSGLLFALAGCIVIGWAVISLGKNLSAYPSPLEKAQLITKGLYRYIRHPIYSGFILFAAGWAVSQSSATKMLMTAALIFFFYKKSKYEERLLSAKFHGYTEYKKHSGRFLPGI